MKYGIHYFSTFPKIKSQIGVQKNLVSTRNFCVKPLFFWFDTVLTKKRWSSGGKSIAIFAINRLILAINRSRFRIVCTHHHDNDPSTDVPRFRNSLVQMVITVMLMFISRNKCQWLDFFSILLWFYKWNHQRHYNNSHKNQVMKCFWNFILTSLPKHVW